jgi:DNA-binding LacI/PurR family transcriptional regulator
MVSPATVSRILTGSAGVSPEKRDAVNALIEKYSFRPNAMARALSETRSKLIGMLSADTSNPYYTSVFTACVRAAHNIGFSFFLLISFSDPVMVRTALFKLQEQRVDAIVI